MQMASHKDPGFAAVMSGSWIGSAGTLGWICHIIAAISAYKRANRKNQSQLREPACASW